MRVTLHVWRVPRHRIGGELLRMARGPRRLRSLPGVRFAKLLGTAAGFGPRDADWTRYAAVVVADREVPFVPPGDRARVVAERRQDGSPLADRPRVGPGRGRREAVRAVAAVAGAVGQHRRRGDLAHARTAGSGSFDV